MAYIQPNTRVLLLTGVPLDETYEHTLYFANQTAQLTYFMSKKKYEVSQTYQRHGLGKIKVNYRPELLYDCNYLMFQNTSYGDKWFYAFVLDVEYVNDVTAVVSYEIDYIQTWWFELTIHECWVDREHIAVDGIGASLTEEGLEVGDIEMLASFNSVAGEYVIVIATNVSYPGFSDVSLREAYNEKSGIYMYWVTQTNRQHLLDYYDYLAEHDQLDGVISCFWCPLGLLDGNVITDAMPRNQLEAQTYTPKNMKCYQYPYQFVEVTDNCGSSKVYKYEYFRDSGYSFKTMLAISPTPEIIIYPEHYNHKNTDRPDSDYGFNESMVTSNLPQCAFSTDSYKVWLAQNSCWYGGRRIEHSEIINPSTISKGVTNIAGGVALGTKLGGPAGAVVGGASGAYSLAHTIADNVFLKEKAKLLPDKYNAGTGNANLHFSKVGFTINQMSCKAQMLKRIDNFFELYGYKCNQLKVPNTHSRPHWNYVKLSLPNITGNIPSDAMSNIKTIFTNGITFWKNPSEVGNYSLNNH